MERVRGILLTLGNNAASAVETLRQYVPEHAVLVCSQESNRCGEELKSLCSSLAIKFRTVLVDAPDDLVECFNATEIAITYLRSTCNLAADEIRIDYSGGKKTMAAAAVLAAAPDGYRFLYIKKSRTIEGVDRSLTSPDNPWTVLEEPAISKMLLYVSTLQWKAASDAIKDVLRRCDEYSAPTYNALLGTLQGLENWDKFRHKQALSAWSGEGAPERLVSLAQVAKRSSLVHFAEQCSSMRPVLQAIVEFAECPSFDSDDLLALDMLSNARRQASVGNFDEAALRAYRAIELYSANRLAKRGYSTKNQPLSDLPDSLREHFEKHKPGQKKLKLSLEDIVYVLAHFGETDFVEQTKLLDKPARNQNWLIHGDGHVDESGFEGFLSSTLACIGISLDRVYVWPILTDERLPEMASTAAPSVR